MTRKPVTVGQMTWSSVAEGNVRTGVCEEVGCDNPVSRVEAMEGVCNGDECCADNRSLDRREEKRNPEPTRGGQPVHGTKGILCRLRDVGITLVSRHATSSPEHM